MVYKKSAMRKWQQDLVSDPGPELSQHDCSQEIKTSGTFAEVPAAQEKVEEVENFKLTEFHMALLIFLISFFILCTLKPVIILLKAKERPEESVRVNYVSVFILSVCTSAIYLGLCYKIF